MKRRLLAAAALFVALGIAGTLVSDDLGAARGGREYRTPEQLAALLANDGGKLVVDAEGRPLRDKRGRPLRVAADGKTLLDARGRPLKDARGRTLTIGEDGAVPDAVARPRKKPARRPGADRPAKRPGKTPASAGGDQVVIGVAYDDAARLDEIYARYGGKARASDGGLVARAVADHINRDGGIGGRRIELRLREFDTTDGRPYDVTFAEVCQWFAEGKRPLAVLVLGKDDELTPCLANKGMPAVNDWPSAGTTGFQARFPEHFFQPGSLAMDRFARPYVAGLVEQGFFSGSGVRVGLIRYSDPQYDAVTNEALKPALRAAGVAITAEESVPVTRSVNDLSGLLSRISTAIVRFRAAGVNRVISVDNTGQVLGLFAQAAGPTGYRPRYGMSSLNSPLFIRASLTAEQVRGTVGIGWSPITDVAADQEGELNSTRRLCDAIFARAGLQELGDRSAYGQYGAYSRCSNLLMLRAALAGRDTASPAGVRAAIESVGARFDSAVTMRTDLRAHDGAAGHRLLRFEDGCGCFAYHGGISAIG